MEFNAYYNWEAIQNDDDDDDRKQKAKQVINSHLRRFSRGFILYI